MLSYELESYFDLNKCINGLSGCLKGCSTSKKYAPKTNKPIPENCNAVNRSPKKKYANNTTKAGLKLSRGEVTETCICRRPLAKNQKAKVARTDEKNINKAKSADIEKLTLSKKTKNKKKIKIDSTVDISRACSSKSVLFSTIIRNPKKIAASIPKKYHSIILPSFFPI
jgi:hypothetical protein